MNMDLVVLIALSNTLRLYRSAKYNYLRKRFLGMTIVAAEHRIAARPGYLKF